MQLPLQYSQTKPYNVASILVEQRYWFALVTLLIAIFSAFGLSKIQYCTDIENFIKETDKRKIQHNKFVDTYVPSNTLIFVMDFGENSVYSAKNLDTIEKITAKFEIMPYTTRVESLTNTQYSYADGDDFSVDYLFPTPLSLDADVLAKRIDDAKTDPLVTGRLVSVNGRVSAIFIDIKWEEKIHVDALQEVMAFTHGIEKEFLAQNTGAQVFLTGKVILESSLFNAAMKDLTVLLPIVIAFGAIIFFYLVRSTIIALMGMLVSDIAALITTGMIGWAQIVIDSTSVLVCFVVIIVALAHIMHITMNYMDFFRDGMNKFDAMKKSLTLNIPPVFLTSVTTIVGFLCMNINASTSYIVFGNVAAIGVVIAFWVTMTLLPAAMLAVPIKTTHRDSNLGNRMVSIANFSIKHKRQVYTVTLLIVALTSALIPLNHVNNEIIEKFDENHRLRVSSDFISENLMDRQRIEFSLETGKENGVNNSGFLQYLEAFTSWLRQQPEVSKVYSYENIIKRINKNMHGDDNNSYQLPDSRELATQYLLLYEMGLSPGQSISEFISYDRSSARVVVFVKEMKNRELLAFEARSNLWLEQNNADLHNYSSSFDTLFAEWAQYIIWGTIHSGILAIILISVVMIIGLRSLKYGLISLIPNAVPAVIVYGLWGLFIGEVDLAVSGAFCFTLGIIVDDTVHILSGYLSALNRGETTEQAIKATFRKAGPALFVNTVAFVSSFLIFAQSDFGLHTSIGYVVASVIATALVFDLLFLPPLLMSIKGAKKVSFNMVKEHV